MVIKRIILRIIHGLLYFFNIFWYLLNFPIALLFFSSRNIWLIYEINFDARDNGYCFFEYVRKTHPDINVYYVISKKNINYSKANSIGKTIEPYSYKHLLLFIGANFLLSTTIYGLTPNKYLDLFLKKHHLFHAKCVNLNHGIDKDLYESDFKVRAKRDLIITGGYPEYLFVLQNYGYDKSEVAYTGLARFDKLHDNIEKDRILIMPTWRRWIRNSDDITFLTSEYFKKWVEFLESESIANLHRKGFEIIYFIHPALNKFIHLFNDISTPVKFCNSKSDDLQELLRSSRIMITDFSSVFFDFAYMKKPIIYYQFDEEQFFATHYKKSSYFSYRENGFGPVCTTLEEVQYELNRFSHNNFLNDLKYTKRSNEFFILYDCNNCERIYNAISKLEK